jgi:nitrogen regulatory protein P-II 1
MKYILAFLAPDRFDALVEELADQHIHGLSISNTRGFGQEHDSAHPEHREHAGVDFVKKLRVEIICRDEEVDDLLAAFYQAVHTGGGGDGKVFVMNVEDAFRLNTGERGDDVIRPSR